MTDIPQKLLDLLHCPACIRVQVERNEPRSAPLAIKGELLSCARCGRTYPVRDGWMPDLVVKPSEPEPA